VICTLAIMQVDAIKLDGNNLDDSCMESIMDIINAKALQV
jgi:hypothetical protein